MPITSAIKKQLKCCLVEDFHLAIEPILLKCGGNACKECISSSNETSFYCFNCDNVHEKIELKEAPINKIVESVMQYFLSE